MITIDHLLQGVEIANHTDILSLLVGLSAGILLKKFRRIGKATLHERELTNESSQAQTRGENSEA